MVDVQKTYQVVSFGRYQVLVLGNFYTLLSIKDVGKATAYLSNGLSEQERL